jgi:hypothetical protein
MNVRRLERFRNEKSQDIRLPIKGR